ncbi:hypothetical protein DNTS_014311 [Danionella cerebrum]|uniref:Protein phosphatase 1 regulatory subunit 35 C-terminal domain-containing protein n=1 Tax=Danionella cerebrum TaxID=2873325 RepID=A0A553N4D1_9TELE|nr:hypothetical protein DNTS_014311 [Danionella translucida]
MLYVQSEFEMISAAPMETAEEPKLCAPEPLSVGPVQSSDLLCPDLDLSVSNTPTRHVQVRFNLDPLRISSSPEPRTEHYTAGRKPSGGGSSERRRSQGSAHPWNGAELNSVLQQEVGEQRFERRIQDVSEQAFEGLVKTEPSLKATLQGKVTQMCAGELRKEKEEEISFDEQLMDGTELNTVLALRAEHHKEAEQTFNPKKAVREKLESSRVTKNQINRRAAQGLNFPRSQQLYHALVSVSLSRDQLISQALQDRPALSPPTASSANQPCEAPDALQFFRPDDMIRERPLLPGDHLPLPLARPVSRPAHTTFDLHHLHRLWES